MVMPSKTGRTPATAPRKTPATVVPAPAAADPEAGTPLRRRTFSAKEKLRILTAADEAAASGEPGAIAASLGINQIAMPMLVPFCLNRNGNAISVANALYDEISPREGPSRDDHPFRWGEALARAVARRKSTGRPPLTFGTVYPFSCHNYELRYWMAACGIDPDADVHLVVIPPPLMVDSLRDGHIDGFCVGELSSLHRTSSSISAPPGRCGQVTG